MERDRFRREPGSYSLQNLGREDLRVSGSVRDSVVRGGPADPDQIPDMARLHDLEESRNASNFEVFLRGQDDFESRLNSAVEKGKYSRAKAILEAARADGKYIFTDKVKLLEAEVRPGCGVVKRILTPYHQCVLESTETEGEKSQGESCKSNMAKNAGQEGCEKTSGSTVEKDQYDKEKQKVTAVDESNQCKHKRETNRKSKHFVISMNDALDLLDGNLALGIIDEVAEDNLDITEEFKKLTARAADCPNDDGEIAEKLLMCGIGFPENSGQTGHRFREDLRKGKPYCGRVIKRLAEYLNAGKKLNKPLAAIHYELLRIPPADSNDGPLICSVIDNRDFKLVEPMLDLGVYANRRENYQNWYGRPDYTGETSEAQMSAPHSLENAAGGKEGVIAAIKHTHPRQAVPIPPDKNQMSPLQRAKQQNSHETVKLLVRYGADKHEKYAKRDTKNSQS